MLRLLTDPRIALDPSRADGLPAALVFVLSDALELRDEAEAIAVDESEAE